MKTIVVCAIFVLELVSSFPYPEPSYYETYEPQQMQIPTLAHSPELYQQQQLYFEQQDSIRRQNYENLLRNQDLNQRLASQILTRPSYNIQPLLNTVHEPYLNSVPLQRPIQRAQYEAPLTQQYYPVQRQQPIRPYQPVQSQEYQVATEAQAEAGNSQGASHPTNNPYHYSPQRLANHPRIQQVLASTPLKKRYLVLHPNGTIEHIDKIERIVQQHPNYILVNAGSLTQPTETTKPGSAQSPVAPQAPVVPAAQTAPVAPNVPIPPVQNAPTAPNAPVASVVSAAPVAPLPPTAPVEQTPNTPTAPVGPATTTAQTNNVPKPPVARALVNSGPVAAPAPDLVYQAPGPVNAAPAPVGPVAEPVDLVSPVKPTSALTPPSGPTSIQTGIVPGPKPTVQPPTGPTTVLPPVTAQKAQPPVLLNGPSPNRPNLPSPILNGTVPRPKPTVPPPTGPTTELPPVSAPTAQPPVWVTATATAVYPPATTSLPPVTEPVPPTVTTPPPVTETLPPVTEATTPPPVTATATATATAVEVTTPVPPSTEDPNKPDSPTTVAPCILPNDTRNDIDLLHVNGAKPVVWFRTKDLDFWEKLTSGKETFDIVYFFNVPREPRVTKETKTTIHADGTIVEELTQTIYDDDDSPPRIIKNTTVTKPDGTQSKTREELLESQNFK